jgi:hypothetical protein
MKGKVVIEIVGETGFRFLDLPLEIRDRIYRLVLVQSEPIQIWTPVGGKTIMSGKNFASDLYHPDYQPEGLGKWLHGPESWLNLLSVNKEIYSETVPIVYGANTFKQKSSTALNHFVPTIGRYIQQLSTVDFGSSCRWVTIKAALEALKEASGLRKLIFQDTMLLHALHQAVSNPQPLRMAQKMSEDLSIILPGLQKAYVAQGRTWKAVDVPCLRPSEENDGALGSKEAQELMELVRKLNEKYLQKYLRRKERRLV